jgi:hypothetical protein
MSFTKIRGHLVSMTSLAFEALADRAPTVSFVHDFPGSVPTPLGHETPGFLGYVYRLFMWILKVPLGRWVCVPIEESGERHVYLATSARYPPKEGNAVGVPAQGQEEVVKGIDSQDNSGMYCVDWDCEGPGENPIAVLDGLRKKGVKEIVWTYTQDEFKRITAS